MQQNANENEKVFNKQLQSTQVRTKPPFFFHLKCLKGLFLNIEMTNSIFTKTEQKKKISIVSNIVIFVRRKKLSGILFGKKNVFVTRDS